MAWRRLARLVVGSVVVSLVLSGPVWAIQCAPYARQVSGINLYGNAWTWWESAAGQYRRGDRPQVGAALVFKRSPHMPSGHVAVVTAVVSSRLVKVEHANWAPRGARKGGIQRNIAVIDESPANDWSNVRVWYPPAHGFGAKVYPAYGFIYTGAPPSERLAANEPRRGRADAAARARGDEQLALVTAEQRRAATR